MANKDGWQRVTIDVPPQLGERLEALKDLAEVRTKSDVIRQAIKTYEALMQLRKTQMKEARLLAEETGEEPDDFELCIRTKDGLQPIHLLL